MLTRLLSPGFRFTLAKPYSSLTGRGTLECRIADNVLLRFLLVEAAQVTVRLV